MKERNTGLSIVRLIAMTMIIVCHILQALSSTLCYYFNLGVYIFLFMSGFLYGGKDIKDIAAFFKKQGLKIYVPYIITLITIIVINILSGTPILVTEIASSVLCLQWYKFSVPNCAHLWYVSCILLCYCMIPLLQSFGKKLEALSKRKKWFTIFMIIGIQLLFSFGAIVQEANKITCFIAAYFIAYWRLFESECRIFRGGGIVCSFEPLFTSLFGNVCVRMQELIYRSFGYFELL